MQGPGKVGWGGAGQSGRLLPSLQGPFHSTPHAPMPQAGAHSYRAETLGAAPCAALQGIQNSWAGALSSVVRIVAVPVADTG